MSTKFVGAVAGVVVVLVAAWFLLLWRPVGHRIKAAQTAQAQAQQTLTSLRISLAGLRVEAAKAPAQRVALRELQAAVPPTPELSAALKQISAAAAGSGATVSEITPSAPTVGTAGTAGTPMVLPLSISASGNYSQVVAFVRRLEALPRLFVVSSITLDEGGGSSTNASSLSLSLSTNMFYEPSAG